MKEQAGRSWNSLGTYVGLQGEHVCFQSSIFFARWPRMRGMANGLH